MKTSTVLLATLVLVPAARSEEDCCPGERRSVQPVFRDAVTSETLAARIAEKPENPIEVLTRSAPPVTVSAEAEKHKPQSLVERSEILHRGELITLVPKRAILHLPDSLRGMRGMVQGKKLVHWDEFYRNNRGWIDTYEVSRAQAEGREPLPETFTKDLGKRSKAVVAVLYGGPISVLPVPEPVEEPANSNESQP